MDEEEAGVVAEGSVESGPRGVPCLECGSENTTRDSVLRGRSNVLWVILFGWIVLLIRGAFAKRISVCRDCGATRRYKSAGSWMAMVVLALLVLLVVMVILDPAL